MIPPLYSRQKQEAEFPQSHRASRIVLPYTQTVGWLLRCDCPSGMFPSSYDRVTTCRMTSRKACRWIQSRRRFVAYRTYTTITDGQTEQGRRWFRSELECFLPFPMKQQPLVGQGVLTTEVYDHAQTLGQLWTSDQPDAETSGRQHTPFTSDRHPRPQAGFETPSPNSSKWTTADPGLRPHGHLDRRCTMLHVQLRYFYIWNPKKIPATEFRAPSFIVCILTSQ